MEAAMKRRTFLTGSAATATALASQPARSHYPPPATGQVLGPNDLAANAARVREQFLKDFDPAYVENVILPYFLVSTYTGAWIMMRSATDLSKADLHVFSKLFDNGLER